MLICSQHLRVSFAQIKVMLTQVLLGFLGGLKIVLLEEAVGLLEVAFHGGLHEGLFDGLKVEVVAAHLCDLFLNLLLVVYLRRSPCEA